MNTTAFAQLMAAYNKWINEKLYGLCAKTPDAEDRLIEGYQPPRISDFDELWETRQRLDDEISNWAEIVSDAVVDQPYEFKS